MGKKVNPLAMRGDFSKTCQWFTTNKRKFAQYVQDDYMIRKLANEVFGRRIADLFIERTGEKTTITVNSHRPGLILGSRDNKTSLIDTYKKVLNEKVFKGTSFQVSISEIHKPEINPIIIANDIAELLEDRAIAKRCMKRAISNFKRSMPNGGIDIQCAGRVGGAEIARTERNREGKMPLSSIKENVQMHIAEAHTKKGIVSVRVSVYLPSEYSEVKERIYGDRDGERRRYTRSSRFTNDNNEENSSIKSTKGVK